MSPVLQRILVIVTIALLVIAQQTQLPHHRNLDNDPFLLDRDIVDELKAFRDDHAKIVEKMYAVNERLAILETEVKIMMWIGSALTVAVVSNLVHSIFIRREREHGDSYGE